MISITIPEGTVKKIEADGKVIWQVQEEEITYHSISMPSVSGVMPYDGDTEIQDGYAFEYQVTALTGYELESVTYTMGSGSEQTAEAGLISIANVTGDIVINVTVNHVGEYWWSGYMPSNVSSYGDETYYALSVSKTAKTEETYIFTIDGKTYPAISYIGIDSGTWYGWGEESGQIEVYRNISGTTTTLFVYLYTETSAGENASKYVEINYY